MVLNLLRKSRWPSRPRRVPLPPGPKGLPLIGNALDLPKSQPWITFTEWSKVRIVLAATYGGLLNVPRSQKYGSLIYVQALNQPMLIVNAQKAAEELLDKRGLFYSDRPYLAMAGEL